MSDDSEIGLWLGIGEYFVTGFGDGVDCLTGGAGG